MEDREGLLLTPFERNLSVWRQLWRTIERSHLVVQIVDARNPLGFRCEDLETYVREVGTGLGNQENTGAGARKNLLIVNKADLLTEHQRKAWADHFDAQNINYAFFSARDAVELQEAEALREQQLAQLRGDDRPTPTYYGEDEEEDDSEEDVDEDEEESDDHAEGSENAASEDVAPVASTSRSRSQSVDSDAELAKQMNEEVRISGSTTLGDRTHILSVEELEALFLSLCPDLAEFALPGKAPPKFCVGLVGYPNVGKSSTINALVGAKKVSVSSTPGHTKNFQTIHLSDEILLCDCPGLVFPQFATTKAGMVCDGVLPIDQMREYTAPVELVCSRIPKAILEGIYGIRIPTLPKEEGGTGVPTAIEFLSVYAGERGLLGHYMNILLTTFAPHSGPWLLHLRSR